MGNWSEQQAVKQERKEKDKTRRDKLAGYFFDLSKLSFAGLVIGITLPLFSDTQNATMWLVAMFGIVLTVLSALLANKNSMEVLIFVFAVGVAIVGGIYLWTFTKSGKKWLASL